MGRKQMNLLQGTLDVLVLSQEPVVPLCLVRAKPIGIMEMRDENEQDDKIIAVAADDPEYNHIRDVSELSPHRLKEVERFFLDYKLLEEKEVSIEKLHGRDEARRVIQESVRLYETEFGAA